MRKFVAVEADAGVRADVFLASKYPQFTRSSLEGLFDNDNVKLGNSPLKSSYRVKDGDVLLIDDELLTKSPGKIKLPVLYEDDDVIVIDKPAGVLSHSKGALNTEPTVASFIAPKVDEELSGNRAGIVHRLDRLTSGIIITAKNQAAQKWLQKQFSLRKTKKTYLAIVEGILQPAEAIIDAPIARNPKRPQTFYVNPSGKPAQTHYKVLKQFRKDGKDYSLVQLKPATGRTHQLRIHMAYIKHPIVGDFVYGLAGEHMLLHAALLELTLPNKTRRTFAAEPPQYLTDFEDL